MKHFFRKLLLLPFLILSIHSSTFAQNNLSDKQLHSVLGIVSNFILSDTQVATPPKTTVKSVDDISIKYSDIQTLKDNDESNYTKEYVLEDNTVARFSFDLEENNITEDININLKKVSYEEGNFWVNFLEISSDVNLSNVSIEIIESTNTRSTRIDTSDETIVKVSSMSSAPITLTIDSSFLDIIYALKLSYENNNYILSAKLRDRITFLKLEIIDNEDNEISNESISNIKDIYAPLEKIDERYIVNFYIVPPPYYTQKIVVLSLAMTTDFITSESIMLSKKTLADTRANTNDILNNFMDTAEIDTIENRKPHLLNETVTHRITDLDKLLNAKSSTLPSEWKGSNYGNNPRGDDDRMPLILVHGWNGDSGMRDPSKLLLWENSEFHYWHNFIAFYLHSEELQKKYHIYLYRYTSYKHIAHSAKIFSELLNEVPLHTDLAKGLAKDEDGVTIMAHSMGGMVSRAMIEEWDGLGIHAKKLKKLITLDTPHRGSVGSMDTVLTNLPKDLDTHGAMDLNYDNFDNAFDANELDEYYNQRRTKNGLEDFDRLYCGADKLNYTTYEHCMEETANPYMKYLNKLFAQYKDTYNKKYIFYTAWHTHSYDTISNYATALATAIGFTVAPVLKIVQDSILDLSKNNNSALDFINNGTMGIATAFMGKYGYSAGGAETIGSSILGSDVYNVSPMNFNPKDTTHPNLSNHVVDNELYHKDLDLGGDDVSLITSSTGKDHPYGVPYRVFWDYDHGTIYEGVATGKGDWDKYINSVPILSESTLSDTKFNAYRADYVNGAMKIRFGKEPENLSVDAYNKLNPLEYEPVFLVIEKDLLNAVSNASSLKKTAQTTSYTPYDDGHYQTGATPSYTRNDTYGIVTDHVTNLEWQDNETVSKRWVTQANYDAGNYANTSGDTASSYCSSLSLDGGGWRLPTVKELLFIVDNSTYSPSIDSQFQNTISNYYWSSTTNASTTGRAWYVRFSSGYTYNSTKNGSLYVRCVRAGQ